MKIKEVVLKISNEESAELMKPTNTSSHIDAIQASIRFTLLHDKDSVIEALRG